MSYTTPDTLKAAAQNLRFARDLESYIETAKEDKERWTVDASPFFVLNYGSKYVNDKRREAFQKQFDLVEFVEFTAQNTTDISVYETYVTYMESDSICDSPEWSCLCYNAGVALGLDPEL